jgi:dTDP-glucose 4,6-dehydratase
MTNRAIIITGCLGFIGRSVTRRLLSEGWQILGVDSGTYAASFETLEEFSEYPNFSFIKEDINLIDNLPDCDVIINCAAETHVGNSIVNSEQFVHSNINGVRNILECMRNYRVEGNNKPLLLHFSTDEVYGDKINGAFTEESMLCPSNPYSATKASADMMIQAWNRTYGIEYIIVRPSNNFGAGQYSEKLIPKSVKYLKMGKKIPLHNKGEPVRDWLHVEDTADAIFGLLLKYFQNKKEVINQIFNLCGNDHHKNLSIVLSLVAFYLDISEAEAFNRIEDYVDFSYSRSGQDVRYSIKDKKLRNAIGFKNKRCIKDDLAMVFLEESNREYQW